MCCCLLSTSPTTSTRARAGPVPCCLHASVSARLEGAQWSSTRDRPPEPVRLHSSDLTDDPFVRQHVPEASPAFVRPARPVGVPVSMSSASASSVVGLGVGVGGHHRARQPSLIPNLDDQQVEVVKQGWISKQGGAKGGRKSWSVRGTSERGRERAHDNHSHAQQREQRETRPRNLRPMRACVRGAGACSRE